jgi:uncharacterized radical SAM superfamily protein
VPFCNEWERNTHFAKHGYKFAAVDPLEYERIADAFMFEALDVGVGQCIRPTGAERLRFDFEVRYFGVARIVPEPECLITFYPVQRGTIDYHGGAARFFRHECARIDV